MNPTQLHPAFAHNLGYDVDAMNDSEKVTIVRRRVFYEELVVSKEEFNQLNQSLKEWDNEVYLSELPMKDFGFPEFAKEETEYIAFPGDVTSFTDDAIGFLFEKKAWTQSYEPIILAK